MNINISFLENELIGTSIPKPLSGTLSGHAAGEPFDKLVYQQIKKHFPENTFRQFEYLNKLYLDNPNCVDCDSRLMLIKDPAVASLLNRGKSTTKNWTMNKQFDEKQNDTADIIILKDSFYNIIDVKTSNIDKNAQPPNIISALKLAKMCLKMIKNNSFNTFDLNYVGVIWKLEDSNLVCREVSIKNLFKTDPKTLYINWAAAMQLQFHVKELKQNYEKGNIIWCKEYLNNFTSQARTRIQKMIKSFVEPYEMVLD